MTCLAPFRIRLSRPALAPLQNRWYSRQGVGAVQSDSTDLTDEALIELVTRGDGEALACLYDRYAPTLLGIALRYLKQRLEAEDLVHDVFLEAWRHAADYDPGRGSVRTWLVLRTRSRALDRLKAAGSARTVTFDPQSWGELDNGTDEDAQRAAQTAPDRARVRRVLVDLPPEQREVLLLGYFEGLSSSEIAERVGIPIGTVKSRVAAALSKLRGVLLEVGSQA